MPKKNDQIASISIVYQKTILMSPLSTLATMKDDAFLFCLLALHMVQASPKSELTEALTQ